MTITSTSTERRHAIIDVALAECERRAREQGWQGPWTPQEADIEYVGECLGLVLRDTSSAGPRTDGLTREDCEYMEIHPAYRSRWTA